MTEWLDDLHGDGNSEAASEKPTKRKRGRPRVTTPEWEYLERSSGLVHKTRRTVVKRFHAMRASTILEEADGQEFGYLVGADKAPGKF